VNLILELELKKTLPGWYVGLILELELKNLPGWYVGLILELELKNLPGC
jgi:hypothetical protein